MDTARETPVMSSVVLDREDPEFLTIAFAAYADLRAKGPVVLARFGRGVADRMNAGDEPPRTEDSPPGQYRFLVTRYDAAVSALVDDRLSSDFRTAMTPEQRDAFEATMPDELRPIVHSMLVRDPPDHTRLRKLVQPSFSAAAMERLKPRIQRIVGDLLDAAEREASERGEAPAERRMDLLERFAYPLSITVISDMLGIPTEDRAAVHAWAERIVRGGSGGDMLDAETRDLLRTFARYLEQLFEQKRRSPTDDMISDMVHAQEEGDRLSAKELLSMVFILFFAGHATTANLIGNGVVALLTHPDQHARFLADPAALAQGMVEEALRYWGPIEFPNIPRLAKEEIELAGVRIPKGASVAVALAGVNRDPEQFSNPDVFDIERPEASRNIAFGKGIHLCIGAPLARIEAQIAFASLFRRFPSMRLSVPAEELRWGGSAGLRGFQCIPVAF